MRMLALPARYSSISTPDGNVTDHNLPVPNVVEIHRSSRSLGTAAEYYVDLLRRIWVTACAWRTRIASEPSSVTASGFCDVADVVFVVAIADENVEGNVDPNRLDLNGCVKIS